MSLLATLGASKIFNSGASAAKEYASGALNQRYALERQHQAQDFSAQQYEKRYQTQTADMKKAGINPMLAATQGASSAPQSSAAGGGGNVNFREAENTSKMATAQEAKTRQETSNLKTEQKNLEAIQDKLNMEVTKTANEVLEIDQKIKTGRATEQEIVLRQELTKRQTQLTEMQFKLATQAYNIGRPEEMASGTKAAEYSAIVEKTLQPVIKALGGVKQLHGGMPK